MEYNFDSFLRYEELSRWLHQMVAGNSHISTIETYGKSKEGRDLLLVTITDIATGPGNEKPALWVDANIHSVETTGGVAACHLIHYLITGYNNNNETVVDALKSRTFYVIPRVNPDGVEATLSDNPMYLRSATRHWPWPDGHRYPGLYRQDIDGDGRVLSMRIEDEHGSWVEHPEDPRVLVPFDHPINPYQQPIDINESKSRKQKRYRVLTEGIIENYDGFLIPTPYTTRTLDLNRNFPAFWGKEVKGSGDHCLSEPEIDALVRALTSRPNVCGYNAYHTNGGFLIRASSVYPDSQLSHIDLWVWSEIGDICTRLSGYPVYAGVDDLTWDKNSPMSGAADDFAYEHLGIYSWTTEFWDIVHAATGHRCSKRVWYLGNTVEEELAIAKWADANAPGTYVHWYKFNHPQLGEVELGGCDNFRLKINPPAHLLLQEVRPHAEFALRHAMLSPKLEILLFSATVLVDGISGNCDNSHSIWTIRVGVANTGFLPTQVSVKADKIKAVLPAYIELSADSSSPIAAVPTGAPLRQLVGQLAGRLSNRIDWECDGTSERALATWTIIAKLGTVIIATAAHQRAGIVRKQLTLAL